MSETRDTTIDQLHEGPPAPGTGADERLFVDLDICAGKTCRKCVVDCSYFFHSGINNGMISAIELATYSLVCRKCEEPHCVKSCPKEALEQMKEADRMLVRHTLRCVSCRSCSHACPYGTVYPELVPRFADNCDFCLDRRERGAPVCISTCPYGALKLVRGDAELDARTFRVGRRLIVHSTHWKKDKA
jgi:Fe-S-cluster-containing hydrogenase component 2